MADVETETVDIDETAEKPTEDPSSLNPDERLALTVVEEICAASGLAWTPVVRSINPPYLNVEVIGDDAAITLGRFGAAIDALQLLANLLVSRKSHGDVRLVMDAADYRNRRAEALRIKAIEFADEVKARDQEAELEPMPSHERRIVHTALADDPDIETWSEGDEPFRRVVIGPKRK